MRLSVVVPAFNEERLLAETLRHIAAGMEVFRARGWSAELIVCDNNSTDRTAAIARAAGATVVFEPVNQIARARNRGAARAGGDWLLFVDADSSPSPALSAKRARFAGSAASAKRSMPRRSSIFRASSSAWAAVPTGAS